MTLPVCQPCHFTSSRRTCLVLTLDRRWIIRTAAKTSEPTEKERPLAAPTSPKAVSSNLKTRAFPPLAISLTSDATTWDEDAIYPSKGQGLSPTRFDVESQTVRGGISTPPTSSMTLFFARANSRSPKDDAPHARHLYNHSQSSSGSRLLHPTTNPILLPRRVSSSI